MDKEEEWLFKDLLVEAIAQVYARIPQMAYHGEVLFRSYAADLVGTCHRKAIELLKNKDDPNARAEIEALWPGREEARCEP